jgi:hypothetical protein
MRRAVADKLLDFCEFRAEEIAGRWYRDISTSDRTPSYHSRSREKCLRPAVVFLKNLRQMYFAKNPYQEVLRFIERKWLTEDPCSEGVPLHEAVYTLILLRRNIWLYAESQAAFSTVVDMYQAIESINRTILLFDYAIYIVAQKHEGTHNK